MCNVCLAYIVYCDLCIRINSAAGMQPANLTELHVICSELGACRLLLVEKGRLNIHTRIRLNISQDDVVFALRTSE